MKDVKEVVVVVVVVALTKLNCYVKRETHPTLY